MKPSTFKISTVAIAVSIAAVAAVTYVQHQVVTEKMEIMVRTLTGKLGLLAVPSLLVLAYRAWAKIIRPELSTWRNGLGLSSMVILLATWLFFTGVLIMGLTRPSLTRFFDPEWHATLLGSTLAGALLAIALRGVSRTLQIAAALLMWAWLQSTIYF